MLLRKTQIANGPVVVLSRSKKTGDVRVLADFRELNKDIKRKPYPSPKITELLQSLAGFT